MQWNLVWKSFPYLSSMPFLLFAQPKLSLKVSVYLRPNRTCMSTDQLLVLCWLCSRMGVCFSSIFSFSFTFSQVSFYFQLSTHTSLVSRAEGTRLQIKRISCGWGGMGGRWWWWFCRSFYRNTISRSQIICNEQSTEDGRKSFFTLLKNACCFIYNMDGYLVLHTWRRKGFFSSYFMPLPSIM